MIVGLPITWLLKLHSEDGEHIVAWVVRRGDDQSVDQNELYGRRDKETNERRQEYGERKRNTPQDYD